MLVSEGELGCDAGHEETVTHEPFPTVHRKGPFDFLLDGFVGFRARLRIGRCSCVTAIHRHFTARAHTAATVRNTAGFAAPRQLRMDSICDAETTPFIRDCACSRICWICWCRCCAVKDELAHTDSI